MSSRLTSAVVLVLSLGAGPVLGQSLLSVEGIGFPVPGIDARVRALGGVAVGLPGPQLTSTDPAAAADLSAPVLIFSTETSRVDVTEAGGGGDFTTTRFPLVGVSYPVEGIGTLSLTFSSVLDQSWQNRQERTIELEGSGGQGFVTDVFSSDGGVSALEVGVARRFGRIAAGVRAGRYTGSVSRTLTRRFDSLSVGTAPAPFQTGGLWRYSGFTASAGATAQVGDIGRVGASVRIGGEAEATPSEDTGGEGAELSFPMDVRLGGSVLLTPQLTAVAGFDFSDWSDSAPTGRTAWGIGGGLEWTGARILGKDGSLRLGARRGELPFIPDDADSATETLFTGGVGIDLLTGDAGVLGSVDLGLEFGSRSFGTTSEDLFRSSLSVRLSGF